MRNKTIKCLALNPRKYIGEVGVKFSPCKLSSKVISRKLALSAREQPRKVKQKSALETSGWLLDNFYKQTFITKCSRMFSTCSPCKGKVSVQTGKLPNRKDLLTFVVQQTLRGEFLFAVVMWLEEQNHLIFIQALEWHRSSSALITASHGGTSAVGNVFSRGDSAFLLSNLQRKKKEISG